MGGLVKHVGGLGLCEPQDFIRFCGHISLCKGPSHHFYEALVSELCSMPTQFSQGSVMCPVLQPQYAVDLPKPGHCGVHWRAAFKSYKMSYHTPYVPCLVLCPVFVLKPLLPLIYLLLVRYCGLSMEIIGICFLYRKVALAQYFYEASS